MNEKKDLLELLENYIVHIRRNYEKRNPLQLNEELCLYLKEKIDIISNNYGELVNLDLNKIRELFPSYNDTDLRMLEYYQIILRDTSFELQEEDYKVFKNMLNNLRSNVNSYMDKINKFKLDRDNEITKLVNPYQMIINKISGGERLNSDDVQLIYNIIKLSHKNINDLIKIMRYLFNETLKNSVILNQEEVTNLGSEQEDEEEIEIIETTNLTYDVLEKLFMKYGINFSKFSNEEQSELQKYGNLVNIEEILKKFSEYGVNVSEYLDTRSLALTNIFLYSNVLIISNLVDNFIKHGILKKENGKLDISLLLERPSRFLKRKKKWARRKPNDKTIDNIEGISGCYEDVIKNLEYFSNEGLDVSAAYIKSGCYFDLPHEKILDVVNTFRLYNIDKKYYLRTLSCFSSKHQADVIDLFIELGHLDYLKNNMSRILQIPRSPIFYKLARANQLGKVPKMYGKLMDGDITYDSREYLGINKGNGKDVTKQYVFTFDGKDYYDDILSTKESNRTNVVLVAQKELISLLDKNFMMLEDNGYPNYRLYNIGGVLLSRTKFLRVYNTLITNGVSPSLDAILYSLTRNSIITKEQFDIVYNDISALYEKVPTKRSVRNR